MTQDIQPVPPANNTIPLGKPEYFVETHTPYRWSSGPTVLTLDPNNGWAPFDSLAAAKAYAEQEHHPSYGEDAVEASYGVRYVTKLDRSPRNYKKPDPGVLN